MARFLIRLFMMGETVRSEKAIEELKKICSLRVSGDEYAIEIVDVLESPEMAEEDRILVTPTLIMQLPEPIRRIIAELSASEKVLLGLDLNTLDQ